jgi:hypothetical protein
LLLVSHDRALLSRAVNTLLVLNGGMARIFHGGYEEYVNSLGGKALWSAMESLEAQRVVGDEAFASSPAARSKRGKKAPAIVVEEPEAPTASKNSVARLRKQLGVLEDEIVIAEVDVEELEEQLAGAAQLGANRIAELSRKHASKKRDLDKLYADWEMLSQDHEAQAKQLAEQSGRKRR